jgi:beta-galactosidase
VVPTANHKVSFELAGPGRIIGVGNGDPSCHEPDVFIAVPAVLSLPLREWRWLKVRDARKANLAEAAEQFDDSTWAAADTGSGEGPLTEIESAVFRARLQATDAMLTNSSITLRFGRIDEDGWVYLNGRKVGESHDWQDKPRFEIKPLLRAGENTIAVAVANRYGPGGINLGVALEVRQNPPPPHWRRSLFNGLAQLIVQSTKQPGEIKLRAASDGLRSVTTTLEAKPCVLRPQVP